MTLPGFPGIGPRKPKSAPVSVLASVWSRRPVGMKRRVTRSDLRAMLQCYAFAAEAHVVPEPRDEEIDGPAPDEATE